MARRSFTVAIDGPAAAGKGTISKVVAAHFGFAHLDTGSLYRAVGMKTLDGGEISNENAAVAAQTLNEDDLARTDLRTAQAADAASKVAVMPEVRQALLEFQLRFSTRDGGAVLDGRDIGTVVCPNADVKLYVTASALVRAQRRFAELQQAGQETSLAAVLADVKARDARDSGRQNAPMKAASDAIMLDTSELDIVAAVSLASEAIRAKLSA